MNQVQGDGRIVFVRKRYAVAWGGYSILKATFSMLEEALGYCRYDRLVLLTGLDYPVKSDHAIYEFFKENMQTEYIQSGLWKSALDHYVCWDHKELNKLLKFLEKVLKRFRINRNADYIFYKGKRYSIYGLAPKWALTGEAALYLLWFWKKNQNFNRKFMLMHAPDDFYVATVLFNSRFRKRIENKGGFLKLYGFLKAMALKS